MHIFLDDEIIDGDLFEQVEATMIFIKKNIGLKFIMTGEPRRTEVWEYPLDALREALINAICHRDYTQSSDISIRIYDDELIIWSPGRLPMGVTIDELFGIHDSTLRNRLIAQVFYDVGLIEQWGSGIKKIIDTCLQFGLLSPILEEYQGV